MIVRTPQELAHLIRDSRTRKALTQAQLAASVGVSRKWIIDLEGGKRTVDLSLMLRTLNALGIELDARPRTPRHRSGDQDIDDIINASRGTKR